MKLRVDGTAIPLSDLRKAWDAPLGVSLGDAAQAQMAASQAEVAALLASGKRVYGVNTGFGQLAQVRIGDDELERLQENLIRSHMLGVGERLPDACVRLTMLLKIVALAQGYSGVRPSLVERLCLLLEREIYPCVPGQGSVGASGDLAPLAHLAGALLGLGEVSVAGKLTGAADALAGIGAEPFRLGPKEGLALLNGTQVSTALGLAAAFRTERILAASLAAGAMSADAIKGSDTPFDERIHTVRGQSGQADVAASLRRLMAGSEIRASHLDCDRVQDPYSIRCQPQVAGACLDVLRHVSSILQTEANAVTDNPLVFAETHAVLSGGNFHAEPVALVADYLALAIAEIGALSERRIALLIDTHLSGLPAFLVEEGGLNSGFMLAQVTAAALASENKSLAHPASVDSIPTSANQEDHVSMATYAARRLHVMLDNVARIVAVELLAAAQGIGFHHPKRSSEAIETVIRKLREISAPYTQDRPLYREVEQVAALIDDGFFVPFSEAILPSFRA